jgi:hypothetical protein
MSCYTPQSFADVAYCTSTSVRLLGPRGIREERQGDRAILAVLLIWQVDRLNGGLRPYTLQTAHYTRSAYEKHVYLRDTSVYTDVGLVLF